MPCFAFFYDFPLFRSRIRGFLNSSGSEQNVPTSSAPATAQVEMCRLQRLRFWLCFHDSMINALSDMGLNSPLSFFFKDSQKRRCEVPSFFEHLIHRYISGFVAPRAIPSSHFLNIIVPVTSCQVIRLSQVTLPSKKLVKLWWLQFLRHQREILGI